MEDPWDRVMRFFMFVFVGSFTVGCFMGALYISAFFLKKIVDLIFGA